MTLWVDIGNTRIKMATGEPGDLTLLGAVGWRESDCTELLRDTLQGASFERVVVSNVASAEPLDCLSAVVRSMGGVPPVCLENTRDLLGLRCGYQDRTLLGVDRWFAMLGGWHAYGDALCVVDIGTAVTADIVNADGQHTGGCIFAGARTQLTALSQQTAQLSDRAVDSPALFSNNTADALSAGTAMAVAAAVDRVWDEARQALGAPIVCLLTGGGVEEVQLLLKQPVTCLPHLVMDGLAVAWSQEHM